MSATSLHHFVSDIVTLKNKRELHYLGHQRFNHICADFFPSHTTSGRYTDPIYILHIYIL